MTRKRERELIALLHRCRLTLRLLGPNSSAARLRITEIDEALATKAVEEITSQSGTTHHRGSQKDQL